MTQFLDRVDAKLRTERDEFVIAELLAKKAAYLARVGQVEQANMLIQSIRQTFNDGRSGRVTCFLLLAEGVLLHNAIQNNSALDKFSRAELLAQALRQPDLIGICSAWKGFIDFDLSRFGSMQRALLRINDLGLEDDHAVQSRLAATLMTAALLIGERDCAQRWFRFSHRHAVAEGDLACIDALLFNRAVFSVARQRVAWCFGNFDPDWAKTIRGELASARNLQHLVGITSLRDHVDLCVARLDLLERKATVAEGKVVGVNGLENFADKHINSTARTIDSAFASWLTGDLGGQALYSRLCELSLDDLQPLDPDERLVALTMYSRMAEAVGEIDFAPLAVRLQESKEDYLRFELELRTAMAPWLSTPTS